MSKKDDRKKPTADAASTGNPGQKPPADSLLDAAVRAGTSNARPLPLRQFSPMSPTPVKPLLQVQESLADLQQELAETKAAMDQALDIINELQNQSLSPEESAKRLAELRKRLT